jgi:hypothetical protein
VLDADLQLNRLIPRKVIDSAFVSSALETVRCLRHKLTFTTDEICAEAGVSPPRANGLVSHSNEPGIIAVEGAAWEASRKIKVYLLLLFTNNNVKAIMIIFLKSMVCTRDFTISTLDSKSKRCLSQGREECFFHSNYCELCDMIKWTKVIYNV